jgi:hypothetical protein
MGRHPHHASGPLLATHQPGFTKSTFQSLIRRAAPGPQEHSITDAGTLKLSLISRFPFSTQVQETCGTNSISDFLAGLSDSSHKSEESKENEMIGMLLQAAPTAYYKAYNQGLIAWADWTPFDPNSTEASQSDHHIQAFETLESDITQN